MVRITRVHGFTERIHQLHRNSTMETNVSVRGDCIMYGGSCECAFIDLCKYIQKEVIPITNRPSEGAS